MTAGNNRKRKEAPTSQTDTTRNTSTKAAKLALARRSYRELSTGNRSLPICSYDGCDNFARQNGVCQRHGAKRITCSFAGCTKQAQHSGVCIRHGAYKKRKHSVVNLVSDGSGSEDDDNDSDRDKRRRRTASSSPTEVLTPTSNAPVNKHQRSASTLPLDQTGSGDEDTTAAPKKRKRLKRRGSGTVQLLASTSAPNLSNVQSSSQSGSIEQSETDGNDVDFDQDIIESSTLLAPGSVKR